MWNNRGGFGGGFGGGYGDSATGGGGYLQSQGGFGSPTATQGDKKSRSRSHQVIPCTVSQLMGAAQNGEKFRIGDLELAQVTVVGVVKHAEKIPTSVHYKVDDMTTAPMDVRQWVEAEGSSRESAVVVPGSYVKVTGIMRSFQSPPLGEMSVTPSPPVRLGTASRGSGECSKAGNTQTNGLTLQQNQVLNLIKSCRRSNGMSIEDLKTELKGMNLAAIKVAVEFLSNEGHIYSTVDEDHYKSTDPE
ncbi:replication protein A 32 kDa subunit isoform X2 [Latimeria chalumnae]|uniref:replication protein A 32 kDa subunit isoform X2 n=1 Tax=Latimeria chalumnae TaxID=7897 RepID=UPI0006D90F0A|nr:PREDICTED: replication protein A 32 kDa subunit isoform X2 [Latimeria chalumnae]|eukprot:XP_006005430.2 PREDICTED: replication protein A 32 kDa subunit isoform X2 [Latimeria chalumnae]